MTVKPLARRQNALQALPKGHRIAGQGLLDRFPRLVLSDLSRC
jgi:hypothetical protein